MSSQRRFPHRALASLIAGAVLVFCRYYWQFAADFEAVFAEAPDLPWYANVLFLSFPWWFALAALALVGLALVLAQRRRTGWRVLIAAALIATLGMPLIVRSGISAIPGN